jgi:hypothetical protein
MEIRRDVLHPHLRSHQCDKHPSALASENASENASSEIPSENVSVLATSWVFVGGGGLAPGWAELAELAAVVVPVGTTLDNDPNR